MPTQTEIRICVTPQELFQVAADEVAKVAQKAVIARGRFTIALSGGSTPRGLFILLASAAREFPWPQTFCFWSDERHVPPDHSDSNYRMANEALLSKVPVPPGNVYRILAENPDAKAAARSYEQTLKSFFHSDAADALPSFDLILLGIGPDGHTASLFPGTVALHERSGLVVANHVQKLDTDRITFTYPLLNAARYVMFLVSGLDKAPALREILEGNGTADTYPAKGVQPARGRLLWLVDRAAASQLQGSGNSES